MESERDQWLFTGANEQKGGWTTGRGRRVAAQRSVSLNAVGSRGRTRSGKRARRNLLPHC